MELTREQEQVNRSRIIYLSEDRAVVIMAAMRGAGDKNLDKLRIMYPEYWKQLTETH